MKAPHIEALFSGLGVLSPVELASRFKIYAEQYILAIEVETKLAVSMSKTGIYPVVLKYLADLSSSLEVLRSRGVKFDDANLTTIASA